MSDRVFVSSQEAMAALARNAGRVFLVKSRSVFQDAYFDSLTSYLDQWLAMDSFAPMFMASDGTFIKTNDSKTRSAYESLVNRRPRLNRPEVDVQPVAPFACLRRFECAILREAHPSKTASSSLKVLWVLQCHLQASILQTDALTSLRIHPSSLHEEPRPRFTPAKSRVSTLMTHLTLHGLDLENASVVRVLAQTLPHLECLRKFEINTFNTGPIPLQACRVIFFACPSKSLESLIMRFRIDIRVPLMDLTVNKTRHFEDVEDDINTESGFVEREGVFFNPNQLARDSCAYGDLDWELDPLWDRPVSARMMPLLHLKFLQLPLMASGYPSDLMRAILKQCPALESLNVPRMEGSDDVEIMAQSVQHYCPRLRHIAVLERHVDLNQEAVTLMNQISEGRAQALPKQLPQHHQPRGQAQSQERESREEDYTIRSLHFQYFLDQDSGLMRAIERHAKLCASNTSLSSLHSAPFLTVIRFIGCRGVRSATLQAILSLCSGLEHLEVDCCSPSQCAIGLGDAVIVRWVCDKIQFLKLYINPQQTRPTPAGNANGGGTTLSAETMALSDNIDLGPGCASASALERLCRKIGRLTELRVLDLQIATRSETMEHEHVPLERHYKDLNFPGWLKLDSADELVFETFGHSSSNKERMRSQSGGYLSALAGLTHLRELRGSFRQDRTLRKDRMGQAEFDWISRHWPQLEVIELISRRTEDRLKEANYDPDRMYQSSSDVPARFPGPPGFGFGNLLRAMRLPRGTESSGYDGHHTYVKSIAPLLKSLNGRMPRLRVSAP